MWFRKATTSLAPKEDGCGGIRPRNVHRLWTLERKFATIEDDPIHPNSERDRIPRATSPSFKPPLTSHV
ncbi:hypothetical protein PAXRUDRAFT_835313 [Paxillus rubicundulus Ve08.2h10]|uniref:Uncharacterized protein n=1 Tax=Paxillus rubicundulus Ve08.2h10 TaxID=930991 RepID=A0A0D0DFL1_9AGAM|nr:hypothetical protein PAXRUDRAFT_835313 [Paxillus rubicundulus Ve08.2h10]